MKPSRLLMLCCTMLIMNGIHAQTPVPTADQVMKNACQKATRENKKLLLIFHASWCGWCKKMDRSLDDEACKKFFDDNFVIEHLTVQEGPEKKNLENKGAEELMNKYNGKGQGLPYWVVLDNTGKLLFDSQQRKKQADGSITGSNMGCPASDDEVKAFIYILKQATSLKDDELGIIAKRFLLNQ